MPDQTSPRRIGYNAALLSYSSDFRAAGIHRHIARLLPALAEIGEYSITAFTPDAGARSMLPDAIDVQSTPGYSARPVGRILWEQTGLPAALRRAGAQLYHGAAYAMPALTRVPSVVTVHDLSFVRLPGTLPPLQRRYLGFATRLTVRRAAALIAVSEFTRSELTELLGADADRVHVVANGVDPVFRPAPPDVQAECRHRYDLPESFILTLGTLQPRKNLGTLLRAYAELLSRNPDAPTIAVVGAPGWGEADPQSDARALGIAERVRLLGYVPDEDLPALYSACSLFAYPSRYEGFGLPVLEALACGAPAIVADAASLPEIGGDAVLPVGPDDAPGWATAMRALLQDDARRASMSDAGMARAARYTWSRAARETADVYGHVLSQTAHMEAARAHA
jgi:glycosyltransferase involved in cell wall biosynthesis